MNDPPLIKFVMKWYDDMPEASKATARRLMGEDKARMQEEVLDVVNMTARAAPSPAVTYYHRFMARQIRQIDFALVLIS